MVIPSFRPIVGGAEKQLEGLLEHLSGSDVHGSVFTRLVAGSPVYEQHGKYELHRLNSSFKPIGFAISLLLALLKRGHRIDIIHCHSLNGQALLASTVASCLLRVPCIIKVTRSGEGAQLARYLQSRTGRLGLKLTWYIVIGL